MLRHAGRRAFASAAAAAAAASAAATDGVLQVCIVGSGPAGLYTAEKVCARAR
jgi:ribulose 1,5-bisphosphate synthetase/thiazole synthase